MNPAGTRAYVANSNMFETGVPSVSVIDTASLSVVATITAGISGQPSGVAVSDDGSLVYVANNNGTVAVIDAATNTVVNTLSPPPGQPRQLAAIVVAGGSVWATDLSTGEVLNVTDNTMPGLFVSFGMMGIAANPSGSRLYVAYGESADGNLKIAIIDVATSFAQQTFTSKQISTTGMDSGSNPGGIAVSPSGAFVYAPVLSENRLAVMNTSNNSVLPLIPVGPAPFGVAVDPMGTRVYVGVSGNRTVTVLDAATNTVLQTGVPVGTNPMGFGSFVAGARPAPPPPQYPADRADGRERVRVGDGESDADERDVCRRNRRRAHGHTELQLSVRRLVGRLFRDRRLQRHDGRSQECDGDLHLEAVRVERVDGRERIRDGQSPGWMYNHGTTVSAHGRAGRELGIQRLVGRLLGEHAPAA